MKRDWRVIQTVLEHVEKGDLRAYMKDGLFRDELDITEEDFCGHIEILGDAGILRNVTVTRDHQGEIRFCSVEKAFITMAGHDLLDALRDQTVWKRIKDKSKAVGVSISWEFIKAAIPVIMKELVK